ncbi:rho GTPase-activating protein 30-like, partial [Neopelma chrysocephalum]|uniref:rho GTPase-activating protein 30-like n=1 Tax=Neopelma chrysocephalum TaxID=114329 RepID=UPI000FCD042A
RKGSLKAKKWRSIFHLGRSGHEAKRKSGKAEDKEEKGAKVPLRPAKSMDSLSSGAPPGKVPQRQQSLDPSEPPPGTPPGAAGTP